jgi:hypothetical protein
MDLPLFLDLGKFRAVHACWHGPSIAKLRAISSHDRLTPDLLVRAAGDATDDFKEAVDTIVKGPEARLPESLASTTRAAIPARWRAWPGGSRRQRTGPASPPPSRIPRQACRKRHPRMKFSMSLILQTLHRSSLAITG